METEEKVRINKYLANKGVCSRREADEWVEKGFVYVNGERILSPGLKVHPQNDNVEVRKDEEKKNYFLLNKKSGYLSTVSENEGQSLLRLLPPTEGLFPIGRLDKESEGLIIVTNDRSLPKLIIGEETEIEKEYEVTLENELIMGAQRKIEEGLTLFGKKLRPCTIKKVALLTYRIILTEGKNRQVRRVFQKIGNKVVSLKRVRIGKIRLGDLKGETYFAVSKDFILDRLNPDR